MALGVLLLTTACGNKREAQKEALRREVRKQFYDKELVKAQTELAHTDSLLQQAQEGMDTLNVRQRIVVDSLRVAADVQGAKIRYIHKKQKEQ